MPKRRSLLERYEIPINHLDFDYVKKCTNCKELEKIVTILRSGEEGYYPDLTKCAEERLMELKPNSKVMRTEEVLPTKSFLSPSEWNAVNEPVLKWINDIRDKDKLLSRTHELENDITLESPPVRIFTKLDEKIRKEGELIENKKKPNRIKSTEYNKWDKYDADTEVLKIDLDEERAREEVERMNRINLKKTAERKVSPVNEVDLEKLTDIEKETLALKYKDRGNDYYRAKEYNEAVWEYTQCIKIKPTANAYNNRAISYLKLNNFTKCIDDCDSCLKIDSKNIKALLRKAQAFLGLDKRRESYKIYAEILILDPNNSTAKNWINDLKRQIPDLPPISATRIQIIEDDDDIKIKGEILKKSNAIVNNWAEKQTTPDTNKKEIEIVQGTVEQHDEDLSKLIVPNKIVKSKFKAAVENMGTIQKESKSKFAKLAKEKMMMKPKSEVQIIPEPKDLTRVKGILIEEI